ncbi:NUDIX domain-containing protein [Paraburkholderia bannensis]|uniref:NUDIX domain-containing protein n=1 Tax=Paraburkholderia bannensis TaxID=765414 RepID=UPI002AC34D09|nr:NUDIX domain-containing protein [Paraburkholderia bannensis]
MRYQTSTAILVEDVFRSNFRPCAFAHASGPCVSSRRLKISIRPRHGVFPLGGIELGESPQEVIVREVMEETGYAIRIHGILGVFGGRSFRYTYPSGDHVEYVVTLFQCKIVSGSGIPSDSETGSIKYFGRHEMPKLALSYPKEELFRPF